MARIPMNNRERQSRISPLFAAGLALALLLASPAAFAYLDPSTGSMVVSAIVGIFASIALALKTYWYKIKAFFRRGEKRDSSPRD
jgi:amino acid permease